jgi:cytochrome c peroxidase
MSAERDGDCRVEEAVIRRRRRKLIATLIAAFVAGSFAGVIAVAGARWLNRSAAAPVDDLAALKAAFRRPATIPFPADNPFSEAKRALGERLFNDRRLSADGHLSCASCHDPAKGFADSRIRSTGVPGRPLGRHTPTLWNLAFAARLFWDGRARSLEEQSLNPIAATEEMAMPVESAVRLLADDSAMARAFARAFPDDPHVSAGNLAKAIATYERTLVSPVTRFDRWIEGDAQALTDEEVNGFRLFTGKAGCANCHSGFAFTDSAFHDNGLPGDDRGRGAVLRLPAADHAFKTPGLRELKWSANGTPCPPICRAG